MPHKFTSGVFGWVGDAIQELQTLLEKARSDEGMALSEAPEHIEEAQRKLEFALDEDDLDDEMD